MSKKALKVLGITALLGLIGFFAYKHFKKIDNVPLPNSNENPTPENPIRTGSSGSIGTGQYASSGSIGTSQYDITDKNRQATCNKDFNCKSFLNNLNGVMEYYNTNDSTKSLYFSEGYGVFMYDEGNNLWFFSIIKGEWVRQLVPSTYYINPNVVRSQIVSSQELGYAKKMCDAVVVTDSYLRQKLDFNNNGCVTPIKQTKPSKGSGGVADLKNDVQCALRCSGISSGQQYVDCMNKCAMNSGNANTAIYKSAIGTSQYNW